MFKRCFVLALAMALAMLVEMPALHAHRDDHVTEHHQRTIPRISRNTIERAPYQEPAVGSNEPDAAVSLTAGAGVPATRRPLDVKTKRQWRAGYRAGGENLAHSVSEF